MATCNDWGVEKKLHIADCPILSGSTKSIPVKEWRLAPRAGKNKAGKQNTQIDLTDPSFPLKDVLGASFKIQLDKSRTHYNESEWLCNVQKVDVATLSRNELLIFTNLSATCDMHAAKLDNCFQDAHTLLAIFVVCHSTGFITVKQEEEDVRHQLNNCDVWYFFGNTISKGKKNDHIFHSGCLKEIIETYKHQFQCDGGGRVLDQGKVWTDNCVGQHKCNQTFLQIATFPENVSGFLILHQFAQKYNFKGVWDAADKVVKNYMRNLELTEGGDNQNATALDCSLKLR
jgi:hypothetical protein